MSLTSRRAAAAAWGRAMPKGYSQYSATPMTHSPLLNLPVLPTVPGRHPPSLPCS